MSSTNNIILIQKASGEKEAFDKNKLLNSLYNVGASKKTAQEVLQKIEKWIYPGVSTKKIYAKAYSLLKKQQKSSSLRYKLKQALLELGPSGYLFEILVNEVFKAQKFQTELDVILEGQCISHEMDVLAKKENEIHLIECKYGTHQGKHVNVQVPLYVHSRTNDIIKKYRQENKNEDTYYQVWIISNTRFSTDSINYAKCVGLKLLAWDYPKHKGLKELLEDSKVYPITILSSLNKKEKDILLNKKIITCSELYKKIDNTQLIDLSNKRKKIIKEELESVCL